MLAQVRTDDRDALINGLTTFIDRTVVPIEEENADFLANDREVFAGNGGYSLKTRKLIRTVRKTAAEAGYYAMFAPTDIGGGGQGYELYFDVWEHLHHIYGPARLLPYEAVSHWTGGPSFLCSAMSDGLRAKALSEIMSGEAALCFAMSEPNAGSDAWSMTTNAVRDGDDWIINGTKQWISHAPHADYVTVFAVTDDDQRRKRAGGITAFMVPTSTEGFRIDSVIRLFGSIGGNEAIISFDDVRVPSENILGKENDGFNLALEGVSLGRLYNAGRCVGLARWALEQAVDYSKTRRTFGRPIAEYQGVSFMLADMAMDIYAGKSMAHDCASRLEAGQPALKELNMVKAYSTEMCSRVFDKAMQIHGGMGLTNEMRLYDGWHQARIVRIADGTGEIMRRNIANSLLAGNVAF